MHITRTIKVIIQRNEMRRDCINSTDIFSVTVKLIPKAVMRYILSDRAGIRIINFRLIFTGQ